MCMHVLSFEAFLNSDSINVRMTAREYLVTERLINSSKHSYVSSLTTNIQHMAKHNSNKCADNLEIKATTQA